MENKNEILIKMAELLFQQIKLQQEVRDKWFSYYLSIIGGVVALSTFSFNIFNNALSIDNILVLTGLIFIFTGIIGVLFYIVYLHQRLNYKKHYNILNTIQERLYDNAIPGIYKMYYNDNPLKIQKRGADFYTLLICNVLSSICLDIGIIILLLKFNLHTILISIISTVVFIFMVSILLIIFNKFERR